MSRNVVSSNSILVDRTVIHITIDRDRTVNVFRIIGIVGVVDGDVLAGASAPSAGSCAVPAVIGDALVPPVRVIAQPGADGHADTE